MLKIDESFGEKWTGFSRKSQDNQHLKNTFHQASKIKKSISVEIWLIHFLLNITGFLPLWQKTMAREDKPSALQKFFRFRRSPLPTLLISFWSIIRQPKTNLVMLSYGKGIAFLSFSPSKTLNSPLHREFVKILPSRLPTRHFPPSTLSCLRHLPTPKFYYLWIWISRK